jgi:predicted kinase
MNKHAFMLIIQVSQNANKATRTTIKKGEIKMKDAKKKQTKEVTMVTDAAIKMHARTVILDAARRTCGGRGSLIEGPYNHYDADERF